jgi:hypothetical protein
MVSKKPNGAWKTFSFRVGVFGNIPKLHLRLTAAVSRLGGVDLISIRSGSIGSVSGYHSEPAC